MAPWRTAAQALVRSKGGERARYAMGHGRRFFAIDVLAGRKGGPGDRFVIFRIGQIDDDLAALVCQNSV